jgi:outer membrane lipoprotein carrier protein
MFAAACLSATAAWADGVQALRDFVHDSQSGRADFSQTVTSPDGVHKKTSTGTFEFQRPNRFRFSYVKPYVQTIVSDGTKVWFYDPDLNQVTVRKLGDALGSTPAALLSSSSIDKDFDLQPEPDSGGLQWAQATPHQRDGTIQWLKAGFRGKALAAIEIADSFGQRSMLTFTGMQSDISLPPQTFHFEVPPGADVAEQ